MPNLAIFASGSGSNAENIIQSFKSEPNLNVTCICTNRKDAYVIERAVKHNIPVLIFTKDEFCNSMRVIDYLKVHNVDWIILAGFLLLVPSSLLAQYPNRIINIHPALLPKYGGKGMYGHHVHQAVIDHHEAFSGITIHYVDDEYDRGDTIFQATCPVSPSDTADTLAAKVHALEYEHFPRVIREVVLGRESDEWGK